MVTCNICMEPIEHVKCVENICACKEIKYHPNCFLQWVNEKTDKKHCEICKEPYKNYTLKSIISRRMYIIAGIACFLYLEAGFVLALTSNSEHAFVYYLLGAIFTVAWVFIGVIAILLRCIYKLSWIEIVMLIQGKKQRHYIELE